MAKPRIVIVGGGLSGLIAFAEISSAEVVIDIVEASKALGGTEHHFKIDLDADNSSFLEALGVPVSTLTPDNACALLKEKLVAHTKTRHVSNFRCILGSKVISILTDEAHTSALGVRYARMVTAGGGREHAPEANLFGDCVVFALTRDVMDLLCSSQFARVDSSLLVKTRDDSTLHDLVLSKDSEPASATALSLNDFVTKARQAGRKAKEAKTRNLSQKGIRQPIAFEDKDGVLHGVALKPDEWVPFKLENRIQLNKFNHLFRFQLPDPNMQSGLFCGQYIAIRTFLDGKEVVRYYSPVSRNSDYGHLDLMIKIEENTENKPMERFMSELKAGDQVEFRGPMGGFEYHRNMYREIGMIAGGTGITPMVQIIRSVANHPEDDTNIKLLYGNYNEEDILCRDELSYYTLTRTNISVYISLVNSPARWSMGHGFVTEEMARKTLPPPASDIIILLCGPPPMIRACIAMLKGMGYTDQMIFSFV